MHGDEVYVYTTMEYSYLYHGSHTDQRHRLYSLSRPVVEVRTWLEVRTWQLEHSWRLEQVTSPTKHI